MFERDCTMYYQACIWFGYGNKLVFQQREECTVWNDNAKLEMEMLKLEICKRQDKWVQKWNYEDLLLYNVFTYVGTTEAMQSTNQ